jgi:uncharacterized protein YabE (DUF348 family)
MTANIDYMCSPFSRVARHFVLACWLATLVVSSWAKSTVSVSVHGVDYSNETFSFSVEEPNDTKGQAQAN